MMHSIFQQSAALARSRISLIEGSVDLSLSQGDIVICRGECLALISHDDGWSDPTLSVRSLWNWQGPDHGAAAAALGGLRVTHPDLIRAIERQCSRPTSTALAMTILSGFIDLDQLAMAQVPAILDRVSAISGQNQMEVLGYQVTQNIGRIARRELVDEVLRLHADGLLTATGLENLHDIAQRLTALQSEVAPPSDEASANSIPALGL